MAINKESTAMKITKNTIIYYIIATISILMLLNAYEIGTFAEQIQYAEFIVNFIDIASSIVIFYGIRKKYKSFIILPLSIMLLFLMNIGYLAAFYFKIKYTVIMYFIVTYSWYIITVLGLVFLLLKFVYNKRESYLLLISFLLVALTFILLFSPNFFITSPLYSIDLAAHMTIFYLCVLLIIATQNKYALLALAGLCLLEIGNFAMTSCHLQHNLTQLVYGEFCFLVGLFILSVGMLNIIRFKLYNPDEWFFKSTTVRNKFSFVIFLISIWSFIIAAIIIKQLGTIDDNMLVFIPAFGMLYSLVTAVIAVIVSKQMEQFN